ncbi:hypothetical protein C1T30_42830, partial [Bacillus sp. MBGLi97]
MADLSGGIFKLYRKRYLKDVYYVAGKEEVSDILVIIFIKEDASGVISGHDDLMVIIIILANANFYCTL